MKDAILVDECLSAALVAVAKSRGLVADYVPHLGLTGWKDWSVVSYALERDYVIVTNNRRDFLKEYARHDFHNGLIVLVPNGNRAQQIDLFNLALDAIAAHGDIINLVVEVFDDGTVEIREWTRSNHDPDLIKRPDSI